MTFEKQYPRKQETIMQRLERERKERQIQMLQEERDRKEAKRVFIGMTILIPVMFILWYTIFIFAWAITPEGWW